jgi:hypothetical protein
MNIRPVKYENPMKHVYFEPHFELFNQSLCIRTVVLKLVVLKTTVLCLAAHSL